MQKRYDELHNWDPVRRRKCLCIIAKQKQGYYLNILLTSKTLREF